ncbi:PAC2 family protein [Quadrisphaera sp. DSM 44207]|uniref:PAC2 family protein n=1 Tax=Quadrisphaera sp. DSM 44207 TaxID=1881057 RepID=UPI000880F063|nr:PAC2 family protein [Quadrisphaera sp. DSM 44207]SDQ20799.1 Predicted ATP-dependent carboligase, ATP-grasp superfamily [Quadrisphaera sp. DSM 44207]
MLAPEDLYEVVGDLSDGAATTALTPARTGSGPAGGLVLVHALTGFVDAGAASSLAVRHLLAELPSRPLARFDLDQLYDYRARRPPMSFSGDRFTDVDLPELVLHEVHDREDRTFLLLVGPEPDVQWQRFAAAVGQLVGRFGVDLAVSLQGIPWAAPHTRPIALTAHASERSLIAGRPRWIGEITVPGHAGAFLELHLARSGVPSMGFSAHVPHYLASAEFPPAAVALLDALAAATGLSLPVQALAAAGSVVLGEVDAQVAASPETSTAVASLEHQYDAVLAGRGLEGPSLMAPRLPEEEVADGDELAAELERYLRQHEGGAEGPGAGGAVG